MPFAGPLPPMGRDRLGPIPYPETNLPLRFDPLNAGTPGLIPLAAPPCCSNPAAERRRCAGVKRLPADLLFDCDLGEALVMR